MGDSFDDLYPDRELITWVRDPVERVVSNYYHFHRAPDMRDDTCRLMHEQKLDLRAFADLDWMRNLTSRYLSNKPVSDFKFVGIAEQFAASLKQYSAAFGLPRDLQFPRVNTNPERQSDHYALSPADHAYIAERNAADLVWYRQALERLEARRAAGTG